MKNDLLQPARPLYRHGTQPMPIAYPREPQRPLSDFVVYQCLDCEENQVQGIPQASAWTQRLYHETLTSKYRYEITTQRNGYRTHCNIFPSRRILVLFHGLYCWRTYVHWLCPHSEPNHRRSARRVPLLRHTRVSDALLSTSSVCKIMSPVSLSHTHPLQPNISRCTECSSY